MNHIDFKKDENFYTLLENELNIYHSFDFIKTRTLEELDLTKPEIDLFLNQLETTYDMYIEEWEVKMDINFGEFIKEIVANSNISQDITCGDTKDRYKLIAH